MSFGACKKHRDKPVKLNQGCPGCEIEWLRAEVDRLQAIVDRLPQTADGVPIVPGMAIYDGLGTHCTDPWIVTGFRVGRNGELTCVFGANGSFDAICSHYYSTREAAEETRSKEEIELERERSETPQRRRHWTRIGQFDSTDHDPC